MLPGRTGFPADEVASVKAGVYLLLGMRRQPVCPEQRGEDGEGVTRNSGPRGNGCWGCSIIGPWDVGFIPGKVGSSWRVRAEE